ncbi:hypothetical protein Poli38472_007203 [Pythium oligandrum]|uniref:Secreted protein n=1 Tax=Pythium oligandrum TaxID=41045 RepID=A0A8K1C9T3_PYTOL|nr:hypothetical protein Poli38472_007203 [Pythium oligandrum]|eukprot:TMW59058.1 hypothetical protein Poli38472_007203 [Pythium oligandrum]
MASCHVLLASILLLIGTIVAQSTPEASGNGFIRVTLADIGVYDVALAESLASSTLQSVFPSTSVKAVDLREAATVMSMTSSSPVTSVELLYLIGSFSSTTSTTALAPLAVDLPALQSQVSDAFVAAQLAVGQATLSIPQTTEVLSLGPFAALELVQPPADAAFLRVDMVYRNLLSPSNVTQSLLYHTRRGIARFLSLASLTQVTACGPPDTLASSVLLVQQCFYVGLPISVSPSMDERERLGNLLLYGDPSRPVTQDDALGTTRPAMFLDFVVIPSTPLVDPMVVLTLPYIFSSLSFESFPVGNPPLPPAPSPLPSSSVIPATSPADLLARMRKKHRFVFSDVLSPVDSTATPPTCPSDAFCTYVTWNNTVDTPFWVESIESVERLAWSLFPDTSFGIAASIEAAVSSPSRLSSPIVGIGDAATPPWTFSARSGSLQRLDFAVTLRSLVDNATRLTVDVSTDIRSPNEAASTVTSIARRVTKDKQAPSEPIYTTSSNLQVAYDAHLRSANEIALILEVRPSGITQKDTSQPCAHCQNVYEWCQQHTACALVAACVLRDGLEAAQIPATLLQSTLVQDVVDVSPIFRRCLPAETTVDIDALLLFTSAVRCQLQRLCVFRAPQDYGLVGIDDRVLLWELSDGVLMLQPHASSSITRLPSAALNEPPIAVSVRLPLSTSSSSQTLCEFSLYAETTTTELEDVFARQCRLGNYMGRVSVRRPSDTQVEFRFRYLVGPLPTLSTTQTDFESVVTALPTLRLRLEMRDFATALPVLPPSPPEDICASKCRRLALDTCLRDLACVAYTDCITRFTPDGSTVNTGDAIMNFFGRNNIGDSLSLASAIQSCNPQENVNDPAWRALVSASACYAKNACPLSLNLLFPDALTTATWRLSPSSAQQRLIYQQPSTDTPIPAQIPLQLVFQGAVLGASSCAFSDPLAFQDALRRLLQYDDVVVRLEDDSLTPSGLKITQWTIEYTHWLGLLPRFIDDALAPTWTLVAMPSATPADAVLEMTGTMTKATSTQNETLTTYVALD